MDYLENVTDINVVLRELEILEREYLIKKGQMEKEEEKHLLKKISALEKKLKAFDSDK